MGEKFSLLVDCKGGYSSDLITFHVIHECDDEFHDNAPTCWGVFYKSHYIWITKNPQNKSKVFSVVRRWISRNIWEYV